MQEGIVLGHHVSAQSIKVDPKKVEMIKQLQTPENQTDVRSFLGHVGYYRRFIQNLNKIAAPLFASLHKDTKFEWTGNCETSFQLIKQKLMTTPSIKRTRLALTFPHSLRCI